ncbi:MFS transporter [Kribbella rubisoli]|uniref:MFS transporter n=1 Tax=Kribbella rubisoli TaxID=3075929 RepID=UPI0018E54B3D|nr:MFS transporter [Kribbella rubisoli]
MTLAPDHDDPALGADPLRMTMLVTAAAIGSPVLYLTGAVIGGGGFGVAFLGGLRALTAVIPAEHRAAVMSAFYVVACAAISLPAIAGGIVAGFAGVRMAFVIFGGAAAGVALLVALLAADSRPRTVRSEKVVALASASHKECVA